MTDTPSLLAERARTHGDFRSTAWVAQTLRDTFRHELGWRDLSTVQREALDSMAVKIARILSGDANCADHWVDCIGYAELALVEIRETEKASAAP